MKSFALLLLGTSIAVGLEITSDPYARIQFEPYPPPEVYMPMPRAPYRDNRCDEECYREFMRQTEQSRRGQRLQQVPPRLCYNVYRQLVPCESLGR